MACWDSGEKVAALREGERLKGVSLEWCGNES